MSLHYEARTRALNIKHGERVLIKRKAEDEEDGWENGWDDDMDIHIDTIGVAVDVHEGSGGVRVRHPNGEHWYYPFFVLDFIDR